MPSKVPPEFEKEGQATFDELQKVNLGTDIDRNLPSLVGICPLIKENLIS